MIIFSDQKITHEIIKTQIVDNIDISFDFTGLKFKIYTTLVYIVDNLNIIQKGEISYTRSI
jgi:hypothetical protein